MSSSKRGSLVLAASGIAVGLCVFVACVGDDPSASNGGSSGDPNNGDASGDGANSDGSSSGGSFKLTVTLEGDAGTGSVTSAPSGIDCGLNCQADFNTDTAVTLTAAPTTAGGFFGWTKDGLSCGSLVTCAVQMTAAKNVGAMFGNTKNGWVQSVSSTGNDADTHAVLDKDGNIFFATNFGASFTFGGKTYSSGNIFLAKLSPTGAVIWAKTFGSGDSVGSIAVGKNGEIALAGITGSTSSDLGGKTLTSDGEDPFVVKYSGADGTALWGKVITTSPADGPGMDAVAVDGTGNVIVMGHFNTSVDFNDGTGSHSAPDQEVFLAKYASADGSTTTNGWKRYLTGAAYAYAHKILVDSTNDFIVGGYFAGTVELGPAIPAVGAMTAGGNNDGFVAKFQNVNGTLVWRKQFGAGGDDDIVGIALVDSTSNDIAAIARYSVTNGVVPSFGGVNMTAPTATSYDVAIGKLASGNGNVQWAKRYGGAGSEFAYDIAVLAADRYAITGYSTADVTFDAQPGITFAGAGGDGWFVVLEGTGGGVPSATWAFKAGSAGLDTGQVVLGRDKLLFGFGKFIGDGIFLGKTVANAGSYDAYLFGAVVP